MNGDVTARLDRFATRYATKPAIPELCFAVEQPEHGISWAWGPTDRPYFIASISKLFTVALTMQLRAEGRIDVGTPVADLLGEDMMRGLVVHDGVDHATRITIAHLLTQTSGIPDYYEQPDRSGVSIASQLGTTDRTWSFAELLDRARAMPSPFPPRLNGPAHYSDTNFQLLGRVAESCAGVGFIAAVRSRIIDPLGLKDTWHFTSADPERYGDVSSVHVKQKPLRAPGLMASATADGGIVSTTADQLRFLRAFVSGDLFPVAYLNEMTSRWRRLTTDFGPLRYGMGIMRFALPRWQTIPFRVPPMIGHSGSFGTVLYHSPETRLFVAGTVNQTHPRRLPYPLLARIAMTLR